MQGPVDPRAEQELAELLATAPPGYLEWRRSQLEDPKLQRYRDQYPDDVASFYDPEVVRAGIRSYLDRQDPFSARSLLSLDLSDGFDGGGRLKVPALELGGFLIAGPNSPGGPSLD